MGRRGFLFEVDERDDAREASPQKRATRGPHRLFLYGTLHLGRVGGEPFPAVVRALGASRRLALEADPTDAAVARKLTMQFGRYPDGDGLSRHVPTGLVEQLRQRG